MSTAHRIRAVLRRAARQAAVLIPSEPWRRTEPTPGPAVGEGQLRLHYFSADFDSPAAARAFCYAPTAPDAPVPLNLELEGAFVDTAEVEVITGDIRARLTEFLSDAQADDLILRMGGDSTLILITEAAFGGLPYDLEDTATLTYLGDGVVEV